MVAVWFWGALATFWALECGVHGRDGCGNPLLGTRGFTPPQPSQCALRCATLTYYRILGSKRKGSVLFTEATTSSKQYYCWFLSQRCPIAESLETAYVVVNANPSPCQIVIDHNGSGQQLLSPDMKTHELLSPACGVKFEVTLPFQRSQNAAEFCVRHACPQLALEPGSSPYCPPFLVTLWDGNIHPSS